MSKAAVQRPVRSSTGGFRTPRSPERTSGDQPNPVSGWFWGSFDHGRHLGFSGVSRHLSIAGGLDQGALADRAAGLHTASDGAAPARKTPRAGGRRRVGLYRAPRRRRPVPHPAPHAPRRYPGLAPAGA